MNVIHPMRYRKLVDQFLALQKQHDGMLEDQDALIGFPFAGHTRFLMITNENERLHMQIFMDVSDVKLFLENMQEYADYAKCDTAFRLNFVQIDMRDVEDMFDEEYDAYAKAGIKLEEEVPIFRNFTLGQSVWVINDFDAGLIEESFDLLDHILKQGKVPEYGFYQRIEDQWEEEMFHITEAPKLKAMEVSPSLEKLTDRKRGKWLIGNYFLPFPKHFGDGMRPIHIQVCIIVDEETEEIVEIFEQEDNRDPYVSFNEQLYEFMKKHKKRPRSVAFFAEEDEQCYLSLFEHLDVEIADSNQIDLLNDVWLNIENEFLMNLEMAMEMEEEHRQLH